MIALRFQEQRGREIFAISPSGHLIRIGHARRPSRRKRICRMATLLNHSLYRGMQARVAARLGVSKSVVSRVASGQKRSRRIEKALLSEEKRIERQIQKARAGKEEAA